MDRFETRSVGVEILAESEVPQLLTELCFANPQTRASSEKRLCPFGSLHATAQPKQQMQSRLLRDVVIGQNRTVLKLLAREDKSVLVWQNAFLVMNLLLHHVDGAECGNL